MNNFSTILSAISANYRWCLQSKRSFAYTSSVGE
jgi:hypothetical protein